MADKFKAQYGFRVARKAISVYLIFGFSGLIQHNNEEKRVTGLYSKTTRSPLHVRVRL